MATRQHIHEESFPVQPELLFALLHSPSAICSWWGAARAIVIPEPGGLWSAAWGEDEDDPDYITCATMSVFDPPRRIVFSDYRYHVREGGLPFSADFVTTFDVKPHGEGASLRVCQDGFPVEPESDDFYEACGKGWRDTFAGIRVYVGGLTTLS